MIGRPRESTPFPSPSLSRPLAQQPPRLVHPQVSLVVRGRDAGGGLEQPLEVELAQARLRREPFEAALFSEVRSEEHTSELQSRHYLVCRLLLEKKKHYAQCT